MSRSLVGLPVQPGWIPSWEERFYDPSELADPAGVLLAEALGEDPVVRELVARVEAMPADTVAGRTGGFALWGEGLPDRCDRDLVTGLAEAEHASRVAAARQVALVQELCSRRGDSSYWIDGRARFAASEFTADHLALALGISLRSATNRINEAETLRAYPKVLAALGAGLISLAGVRSFLREVTGLDLVHAPELAAIVETHVLNRVGEPWIPDLGTWTPEAIGDLPFPDVAPLMGHATPGQVAAWTRRGVALADRDAVHTKAAKAAVESMVELSSGGASGMSWLGAWLPDAQAAAGYDRIDQLAARRLRDGQVDPGPYGDHTPLDGEALSLDAVRAGVFFDLLMSDEGGAVAPVNLTVLIDAEAVASTPVLGPISTTTLESLQAIAARTGGTARTITQPALPCPGEHPDGGRDDPYVVPEPMRRFVQLKDRTCRYPGCTKAATGCDLDHTIPWPAGPTCPCNLAALCRHHHRLKTHEPGWTLTNHGHGSLTWTTPYGTFHTRP